MSAVSVPLDRPTVQRILNGQHFDVRTASIREMNNVVNAIETDLGVQFIRMEFGVPGLPANPIAIEAETRGPRERNIGHVYAPFEGVPALKDEGARFVKLFMDIDVPPSCVVPTVGAMQGCFASIALASRLKGAAAPSSASTPAFPVNRCRCGSSASRAPASTSTTTAASG